MSADGTVVVGGGLVVPGEPMAFRWTADGGMQALGAGSANAVSDDGTVVAGDVGPSGTRRPYRWTAETGRIPLDFGREISGPAYANGISGDGSTVVGNFALAPDGPGYRWTPAGEVAWLPHGMGADAASDDGSVIAGIFSNAGTDEAARWTAAGGVESLGSLPGGTTSVTEDLSADGAVVVGYAFVPSGLEAFVWRRETGMVGLGDLAGGSDVRSFAKAVNADGSVIVGAARIGFSDIEAFIWDPAHGMRRLMDVLVAEHDLGASLEGWKLQTATGISPDGRHIVGFGSDPLGQPHGWLVHLNPPAPPPARVVARHVFYNSSSFDGNNGAAAATDDNAIAPDKNALLANQDRLPGFDNVISYNKGINGVMIDVMNLPVIDAVLDANDFDFGLAGNPISIDVRPGAGVDGSDRVTLIWRDYNPLDASPLPQAIANGWLTVTVKANGHTGLAAPDVFSFGNLVGETGDGGGAAGWRVNALDLGAVKKALNTAVGLVAAADFNRDGRVNALDLGVVKRNLNRSLPLFAPAPALLSERDDAPVLARVADEIL